MPVTGGCRCHAVRYQLAMGTPPPVYACHCLDCQTSSGSAFAQNSVLPEPMVAMTGPLCWFDCRTAAGTILSQAACSACRTVILNRHPAATGLVVLRAGTLDDSAAIVPFAHIWVKRKQPWLPLADGIPSWDETPTREQFAAALPSSG